MALIHEGEAVIPKAYNPAAGGKASGGDIHITQNVTVGAGASNADVANAMRVAKAEIKGELMPQPQRGTGVFR